MKRTISSAAQSVFKMLTLVFSVLFLVIFLASSLDAGHPQWSIVIFPGSILCIFLVLATVHKTVQLDGRYLYVSTFRKVTAIPLEQIRSVNETIRLNYRLVTIHFLQDTPVGRSIRFTPTVQCDYRPHSIVSVLQAYAHDT